MDTKTLEKFCPWARNRLMEAVDLRCRRYGLTDDARTDNPADSDVVDGTVLTAAEKSQRATLYARIEECGYTHFLEEMAYTWFNRFAAIRYMELHDYLPSRVRMLSCTADGSFHPDCLRVASELELPGLDKARVFDFMDAADDEGLFRLILLAQCNELADALPEVFAHLGAADELMLPDGLLRTGENDVIYHLVTDVPEETWQDVEVLGWMYQFYNSERKDDFFKAKRKASADDLAPATQLFTPKWIVQYLVENSLGRLWMLNNPSSHLRDQMKYFIAPDDEHEDFIRVDGPEDITFCDPACGSGHILSYAFELLYAMYEERGYRPSEIPELILEKNLTGFEIDERAAQIASLVLAMRAREHDRRFIKRDVTARIHVFQSVDCEGADLPKSVSEQLEHLGEIGSLVKLSEKDLDSIHALTQEAGTSLLDSKLAESLGAIEPALHAISNRYDVVVANPPYMGSSSFNPFMCSWIKRNYPDVKSDLFSSFIPGIMDLAQDHAEAGIMCPFVWMFIGSYEKLRNKMIDEKTITSLIQFEYSGFAGATVPICTFTFHNEHILGYKGGYVRLSDFVGPDNQAPKALEAISNPTCGWFYRADASAFHDIPGSPFAYWVSNAARRHFVSDQRLSSIAKTRVGIQTGNNEQFIHYWWENNTNNFGNLESKDKIRWCKYAKGGGYRKWGGGDYWSLDLANTDLDGKWRGLIDLSMGHAQYLSCNLITSGVNSYRMKVRGILSDHATVSILGLAENNLYTLGVLNSSCSRLLQSITSPTLNNNPGEIGGSPIPDAKDVKIKNKIKIIVFENTQLSTNDWDSQETSWDFRRNTLV